MATQRRLRHAEIGLNVVFDKMARSFATLKVTVQQSSAEASHQRSHQRRATSLVALFLPCLFALISISIFSIIYHYFFAIEKINTLREIFLKARKFFLNVTNVYTFVTCQIQFGFTITRGRDGDIFTMLCFHCYKWVVLHSKLIDQLTSSPLHAVERGRREVIFPGSFPAAIVSVGPAAPFADAPHPPPSQTKRPPHADSL